MIDESENFGCPHVAGASEKMLCHKLGQVILTKFMKIWYAESLFTDELAELDACQLSAKEIIEKIRGFTKQKPSEEECQIFLSFLVYYPVSMCKRSVTSFLQFLIGALYRTSQKIP